ncbi:MAG: L-aspartate oxidase [Dehalococcoidia bacterium]|nr:L-aspartate oxidase [Chloroflexota bacterium]MCK4241916.1 L-aspartate oxidase [Dehalococcoidia bacterium]
MNEYNYIIVGSGIAGLYTSLLAREHGTVLILTKGSIDECNTKYAQGGIAAAIGQGDSAELHFRDTMAAGAGLCDPEAVRLLVEEAPDRITDLVNFGVPFDTLNGEVALTREAAHSVPRILHAGGDATGEHIEVTLSRMARLAKVTILEHFLATEIIVEDGVAKGVRALDCSSGSFEEFGSKSVILATGGGGGLFKFTTNPEIATGDGIALAYRAGAEITDMEFFQFHPTALRLPGVTRCLISEAVRGEGGILRNEEGRQFMFDYSPDGDLAPRDIVARGILSEMRKTGSDRVFLDVTHLPSRKISARFPHIYRFCLDHGLNITKSLIPVSPAAHYMMGGVKTNVWGETNIAGLFAAGEAACTGVHGANRLASNSLLEVVVFAKRILERTGKASRPSKRARRRREQDYVSLSDREATGAVPALSLPAFQSLMWDKVGIVRSGEELEKAASILASWQETLKKPSDRPSYELSDMILVGRLMAEAALIREESRGAHFRTDFPEPLPAWQRHIVFRKTD